MKNVLTAFLVGVVSYSALAQDSFETAVIKKEVQTPQMYLDSIKKTFVNHKNVAAIDKKWMNELMNDDLFAEMEDDINRVYLDEDIAYDLSSDVLKERLKHLDAKSLFKIEYNETLENVIKNFLKKRSKSFERLMALSEYYFPMFEESLAKYNVPLEMKYLAIVESALNPKARSRVGATGLWQFMYPTGKQYGLEVNSFVDERSDPLKSTDAAAKYLSELYDVFGNWELVLASYNYGPGNVSKAIRRSGGETNYWKIRKNLPKETQGYVPAFLATMYIYEYYKQHNIVPKRANIPYVKTDTIYIKEAMTMKNIADLMDMSENEVRLLNPKYKTETIPSYDGIRHYIRLPLEKVAKFTSNERKIYAYLAYEKNYHPVKNTPDDITAPLEEAIAEDRTIRKAAVKPSAVAYHTVKKGESLGKIAARYDLSVAELKQLNGLKGNTVQAGKKLTVKGKWAAGEDKKTAAAVSKKELPKSKSRSVTYTVKQGDTLASIAKKHGNVTVAELMKLNNIKNAKGLKPGMKLKVNG